MTALALASRSQPAPAAAAQDSRQAQLLESLISDFQWTLLHAAALHYLVQAAARQHRELSLESSRHLLHDTTTIATLALRYAGAIGLDPGAEAALICFYAEFAQALSTTLATLRRYANRDPIPAADVPALAPCWRSCCDGASQALQAIDIVTRARLVPEYAQNAAVLAAFLQEGARGQTERLGRRGELMLPKLAQRRRHVRAALEEPCTILYAGRSLPAILRDVSVEGLGLTCAGPLPLDEAVTVLLRDGRRLAARIIRREREMCGLRLERPMAATDRLLAR